MGRERTWEQGHFDGVSQVTVKTAACSVEKWFYWMLSPQIFALKHMFITSSLCPYADSIRKMKTTLILEYMCKEKKAKDSLERIEAISTPPIH